MSDSSIKLTPDGVFYIAKAKGQPVPKPFNLRPLMPWLLGEDTKNWDLGNFVALMIGYLAVGIYCMQHDVLGLTTILAALGPAVWFWWRFPVTTDVFGIVFALLAAIIFPINPTIGVIVCVIGAFANEKVPVFAALYCWHPVMLVGLAVPAVLNFTAPVGNVPSELPETWRREMEWVLEFPRLAAKKAHAGTLSNARKWVLPWGGMLFALFSPSAQLLATLAAGYGMCMVATDSARLYGWAIPVMCAHVAPEFLLPALVVSWFMKDYVGEVGP